MHGLRSAVDQLRGAQVDPNSTTVGDLQDALESLHGQVEDVEDSGPHTVDGVRSALQSAWSNFTERGRDVPSDDTLAEASAAVQAAQTQFQQVWSATPSSSPAGRKHRRPDRRVGWQPIRHTQMLCELDRLLTGTLAATRSAALGRSLRPCGGAVVRSTR